MNFFAVDSMTPSYMSRYDDGVIGLLQSDGTSKRDKVKFMSQLQENGIIESNIFAIYYSEDSGHINFGGWEKAGIDPEVKEGLTLLRTVNEY